MRRRILDQVSAEDVSFFSLKQDEETCYITITNEILSAFLTKVFKIV